jgi:glycosyltransferase involved in cell wall biosynthesis
MRRRILVHDYSGHPFQAQLSRKLAARGHDVLHVHSESFLTPKGALTVTEHDPRTLRFSSIRLDAVIDKQSYVKRYFSEREYGRRLARLIRAEKPDVVISANTPLDAQRAAFRATRAASGRFVFWLQDIQGIAIERLLGERFNGAGKMVGRHYTRMEQKLLRAADAVVAISQDFANTLDRWHVAADRVHVIPNWASLDELPPRPKDNAWARAHGLADRFCFLYAGTIGLKHNPELLLRLALAYARHGDVCVTVVSEGDKARWLERRAADFGLKLPVLPFQAYADMPDVMGSADVLLAMLDRDAGAFSVPSKVLSYLCAARPILASIPSENLAARLVRQTGCGAVVDPADLDGFVNAADALRRVAPEERLRMAGNALGYARRTFDLERIADRFEALLDPSLPLGEEELADELA